MKEQNIRKIKDVNNLNKRNDEYNQQLNNSIKGIHPDERPIKPAASYNFDEMPVGKASNKFESKSKVIQTQNKETTSKVQESNGGGVMMTFDFSDPSPPPQKLPKKNFLKRKVEQKPKIDEIETPPKEEKTEENKTTKKSRFLKKGEKLIYDPLKAVKEAKLKKNKRIEDKIDYENNQSKECIIIKAEDLHDNPSIVNYEDEEIHKAMIGKNLELSDLSYLRKLSKEESFKMNNQEVKLKLISKPSIEKKSPEKKLTASATGSQFQDLKYLKTIPKRVD